MGLPFCPKPKNCGHKCSGLKYERQCLPCLEPECIPVINSSSSSIIKLPAKEDFCKICCTSELGEKPCVQLKCGHMFHVGCVLDVLERK